MSLDELKPGQRGIVVKVTVIVAIRRRLLDLGIRSGETVEMVKMAPLHDPLEVAINGGHLFIRRREASLVSIQQLSD
jgi:Fe2+ transport system protein FeoA